MARMPNALRKGVDSPNGWGVPATVCRTGGVDLSTMTWCSERWTASRVKSRGRPRQTGTPPCSGSRGTSQTRAVVLKLLGEPFDTGWGALFDRGDHDR